MMVVVKVMGIGGGKMELEVTGPCHSDFKQVFHYTRSKKKLRCPLIEREYFTVDGVYMFYVLS